MTITFVTNLVHHHQLPVADEFYKILGDKYAYVACEPLPDWLISGGYDPSLDRPYIIRTYQGEKEMEKARKLIDESDVVIIGSAPVEWVYKRKKENKVTFHYNERWLRFGAWRRFSPRSLYGIWRHHFQFRHSRTYMLCASAFTSRDVHFFGCYPKRCFKWGYFTKVDDNFELEASPLDASSSESTPLMWCARFLSLKHPELPVQLAARLKKKGYKFSLDMFGSGVELEKTKRLAKELGVEDCVHFCGNRPNEEILSEMRKHKIFLFTSDYNEGWGAVLNEAMANGCVPVASNAIGSVPYLIKNGVNGLVFNSCNVESLDKQVEYLLKDQKSLERMSYKAFKTISSEWSPKEAASNFWDLAQHALNNTLSDYHRLEGPASWD